MVRDKFAFICLSCENVCPGPKVFNKFFVATLVLLFPGRWPVHSPGVRFYFYLFSFFFCSQCQSFTFQPATCWADSLSPECCGWLCNYWQSLSGPFRPAGGPWLFAFFSPLFL